MVSDLSLREMQGEFRAKLARQIQSMLFEYRIN
jgi:hypothetical protein